MVGRPLWERKVPGSSPGAPILIMTSVETPACPYLTFFHRPRRGYEFSGDGEAHTTLSPVFETPVSFSSLVLSSRRPAHTGGWLLAEAQICTNGAWSKFYKLGCLSEKVNHSFDSQEDEYARVCADLLKLNAPAQAYRFRLTVGEQADVPDVFVCLTDAAASYAPDAAVLPAGTRTIPVFPVSQMRLDVPEEDRKRLCSPSSLCMALNALGIKADPLETAAAVYDDRARIYGNWMLNTSYACARGCEAFVTRFQKLEQLEEFLTPQSLVVASVGYGRGELAGAAVPHTPGHLVLLCGWENGKVRVADPAAERTEDVIRFYDAAEFARAWLKNKRGAAYLVRKK